MREILASALSWHCRFVITTQVCTRLDHKIGQRKPVYVGLIAKLSGCKSKFTYAMLLICMYIHKYADSNPCLGVKKSIFAKRHTDKIYYVYRIVYMLYVSSV